MATETIRIQLGCNESATVSSSLIRLTAADVITLEKAWVHDQSQYPPHMEVVIRIDRTGLTI